jgi:hypothetical protein
LGIRSHERDEDAKPDDRQAELDSATERFPATQLLPQRNKQDEKNRQKKNRDCKVAYGLECEIP